MIRRQSAARMTSAKEGLLEGVSIRAGIHGDVAFVRRNIEDGTEFFWPFRSAFHGETVRRGLMEIIPAVFENSKLLVAEKEGSIAAYALIDLERPVVYWAQTMATFRRLGLFAALVSHLPRPWYYCQDSALARVACARLGGFLDPFALSMVMKSGVKGAGRLPGVDQGGSK